MEYFAPEDFVNPDKWVLYKFERESKNEQIQRLELKLKHEKERKREITTGWKLVRLACTVIAFTLMSRTDATFSTYLAVLAMAYVFGFAEAFAK